MDNRNWLRKDMEAGWGLSCLASRIMADVDGSYESSMTRRENHERLSIPRKEIWTLNRECQIQGFAEASTQHAWETCLSAR